MSLTIPIDQDAVQAAITATATKAMTEALGGYQMQAAVAKIVTEEMASGAVAQAIRTAVAQVDTEALTRSIAVELERAAASAVTTILREGVVDIVCKLRGIGSYGDDIKRRAEVRAELLR